jgi:hypothetical protein
LKNTIKNDEHVFIAGQTGSGKSFLKQAYLSGYKNVISLDLKGKLTYEPFINDVPVYDNLEDLMKVGEGKYIYRPRFEELEDTSYVEKFFEWIYHRQNTICDIDEIMALNEMGGSNYIPRYAKAILTRGRERQTTIWGATQRPKTIPLVYMSEASHYFIFSLKLQDDRRRVQEFIPHSEIMEEIPKKTHKFWYYNDDMDRPVKASMKIK